MLMDQRCTMPTLTAIASAFATQDSVLLWVPELRVLHYDSAMIRVVACFASASLLMLGCRTEEAAEALETAATEQQEIQPSEPEPSAGTKERPTSAVERPGESSATTTVPSAAKDDVESPEELPTGEPVGNGAAALVRDLAAELNAAVGVPSECLADLTRATPTTIRVSVSALVRPSGALIQPTASSAGLSRQAEQCVARRVDAVALKPLDGDSSERVSTVIEIPYVPPREVVGTKVGPQDPELRNVREPLPQRREAAPSGRPIQEPTSRPIQEPSSRPIQEPSSRKPRGPKPRPIDGWDVDESAKDWR